MDETPIRTQPTPPASITFKAADCPRDAIPVPNYISVDSQSPISTFPSVLGLCSDPSNAKHDSGESKVTIFNAIKRISAEVSV